jgi:hypothetical protein
MESLIDQRTISFSGFAMSPSNDGGPSVQFAGYVRDYLIGSSRPGLWLRCPESVYWIVWSQEMN